MFINTYKNNYKIYGSPKTGEVSVEAECYPLEHHFNSKQQTKTKVSPIQNILEEDVLIKVNVLETQRDTRCKYEEEYHPLESWSIHHLKNRCPDSGPPEADA